MIQQVGECAFKSKLHAFTHVKRFGHSRCNGRCARTFETANGAVANGVRGDGIERVDIEHTSRRGVSDVCIADAVGPLERTSIGQIQISWIVAGTRGGRQIRPGLPEGDCADRPATEYRFGNGWHMAEKSSVAPDRQVVKRGK